MQHKDQAKMTKFKSILNNFYLHVCTTFNTKATSTYSYGDILQYKHDIFDIHFTVLTIYMFVQHI